jgi:hypothetical protein
MCRSSIADIRFLLTKLFPTLRPFAATRSARIVANMSFALQPSSDRAKVLIAATSRVARAVMEVPWAGMPRLGKLAADLKLV